MRMKFAIMCFWAGGLSLVSPDGWSAQDLGTRHGSVPARVNGVTVEAGAVMTFQHASDARIGDEALASVDIVSTIPTSHGHWMIYLEGNTSPRQDGVSTLLPEANKDAATAVDHNDKGRLQVSALHYLPVLLITVRLPITRPANFWRPRW